MNRRMFFASIAGFAAATRLPTAASSGPCPPATPRAVDAIDSLPEWDFTAEDFDAFQARQSGPAGSGQQASGAIAARR
jgi:hypothetical protein